MLERHEHSYYTVNIKFRIHESDINHIRLVKEQMGKVAAIRTLRMLLPSLEIAQAKTIVEEL